MRESREPKPQQFAHVQIVRPTGLVHVRGLILLDKATIFDTHKYDGRTVPCEGSLFCSFCGKLPESQRIYLPLWSPGSQFRFLDLPVSQWEMIRGFEERFKTLLGLDLIARRERPRDNAAIVLHADCKYRDTHRGVNPFPNFSAHMNHILDANREYALQRMSSAESAAAGSSVLDDRPGT